MGRRSLTGGVLPIGHRRIQFDFTIDGVRYRPTLPWIPNEANLRNARARLIQIKVRIATGTFSFAEAMSGTCWTAHWKNPGIQLGSGSRDDPIWQSICQ